MAKNQRKVGLDLSSITARIPEACADERKAVEFLERELWGRHPACPRCGVTEPSKMRDRNGNRHPRFLWRCRSCKKQFTVRIGTVFEDSRIPLRHWVFAFWAACSSKKGVSALQIKRQTGLNYKSALFMMHRIRLAMGETPGQQEKLQGTVEVDETYVGGRPRNPIPGNRGVAHKVPVIAFVERGGRARAFPIPKVNSYHLQTALTKNLRFDARVMTDDNPMYPGVARRYLGGHFTVNHSRREYVRGNVSTNTVEGFFSIFKRGIIGTFHSVSKKHLHRYCSEFSYRYSTRKMEDGERVQHCLRMSRGKRLTYAQQIAG